MSKNAKELLNKYKNGTISADEKLLVEDWFMEYGTDEEILLNEWQIGNAKAEMWEVIDRKRNKEIKLKLWPRIAVAAAIVLIGLTAGLFFISRQSQPDLFVAVKRNDVAPGKNTATLTFGNGKTIILNDQKSGVVIDAAALTYNDGSKVVEEAGLSAAAQQMVASTPRGGTYQILLPDGSRVWMNAASTLKFPSTFTNLKNRTIELSGEAYFEVAKDKEHPFIVKTSRQAIKVLGTHFNVNAYPDEADEKTVLLEGAVNVNGTETLSPGQQLQIRSDGKVRIDLVDTEGAVAWKNGYFLFKDVPLKVIMHQLSRWYNIEIVYNGEPKDETFNGLIKRNSNLSRILNVLEKGGVKFDLQGKKLIVTP